MEIPTSPIDEKTKVIPSNVPPKPAPIIATTPGQNIPKSPMTPPTPGVVNAMPKTPFASLKQNPDEKGKQKKRILSGIVAGGSILLGAIITNSFVSSGKGNDKGETTNDKDVPDSSQHLSENADKHMSVVTNHKVSDIQTNKLKLDDAREVVKQDLGGDGLFRHDGQIHTTLSDAEWKSLSSDEKKEFLNDIVVSKNTDLNVNINGQDMQVHTDMQEFGSILKDNEGKFYWHDVHGNSTILENVTEDSHGDPVRIDPVTGEITQVNPAIILSNIDEGKIDVSAYPSDVEVINGHQPIDHATWLTDNSSGTTVSGWDLDGDGVIDKVVDNPSINHDPVVSPEPNLQNHSNDGESLPTPATASKNETPDGQKDNTSGSKNDEDLLHDKLNKLAADKGITNIEKEKIKEDGDGWDVKIKGDDGVKLKVHISQSELHQTKPEDTAMPDSHMNVHDKSEEAVPVTDHHIDENSVDPNMNSTTQPEESNDVIHDHTTANIDNGNYGLNPNNEEYSTDDTDY